MNWWIFTLLLANAIGWIGAFFTAWQNEKLKKELAKYRSLKKDKKTPEHGETYGHPRPPVAALYEALPAPPIDHAWELAVEPVNLTRTSSGDHGSYEHTTVPSLQLTCRLIKLTAPEDQKIIAARSADLIWKDWWEYSEGNAWAATYRASPGSTNQEKMFARFFLDPFTDWANGYCDTINAAAYAVNPGGEYRIKGA